MEPPPTIGPRVRQLRLKRGLSQTELAERAGITQPWLSLIERDHAGPLRPRTLRGIAAALGVKVSDLTGGAPAVDPTDLDDQQPFGLLPANLPMLATPLIDREHDLAELSRLLRGNVVRLVTLTGTGGVGKTHLALKIAHDVQDAFPDGVIFVSLALCMDTDQVIGVVAQAIGLRERERDARPLREQLLTALRPKRQLLLLDNLEQALPAAASIVGDLLTCSPHLKALATSRRPLHLKGEQEYPVEPLALPDTAGEATGDALLTSPAVQLFVRRATAVHRRFALTDANAPAVAAICRRLEGLPLAIELAAARIKLYSPAEMLKQLDQLLAFLVDGPSDLPLRQQTLRATITWSYDLLKASERMLFRRLSVFAGGFTLDAVEQVVRDELLGDGERGTSHPSLSMAAGVASLLNQNLLTRTEQPDGTPRFGMLETIREYGLEQLEVSGEVETLKQRHLDWCLELAEQAELHLFTHGEADWLYRLDAEFGNLGAALAAALGRPAEASLRLAAALTDYWYLRGYLSEARRWLDAALALEAPPGPARARALAGASLIAASQADADRAGALGEESIALWQRLGAPRGAARAQVLVANALLNRGEIDRADSLYHEALDVLSADDPWVIVAWTNIAIVAHHRGDAARAEEAARTALAVAQAIGDVWDAAVAHRVLGDASTARGDLASAAMHYAESLRLSRERRHPLGVADSLSGIANLALAGVAVDLAARFLGAAAALYEDLGGGLPPTTRLDWNQSVAALDGRFDAAWAAGAAMPRDQAIAEALAWLRDQQTTSPS